MSNIALLPASCVGETGSAWVEWSKERFLINKLIAEYSQLDERQPINTLITRCIAAISSLASEQAQLVPQIMRELGDTPAKFILMLSFALSGATIKYLAERITALESIQNLVQVKALLEDPQGDFRFRNCVRESELAAASFASSPEGAKAFIRLSIRTFPQIY